MWHKEVTSYRDESYYLINDAMDIYREHLQQVFNRGMIEAWITKEEIAEKSPWSAEKTIAYFEKLPNPENDVEQEIWLAGYNSTQTPKSLDPESDPMHQPDLIPKTSKEIAELAV